MKKEFLDVLNEDGEFTGETMDRKEIHEKNIWHRCVHIWIINSKGELLLQKRAKNKDNFGGLWDISAAGHVESGETREEAALKETFEELGLQIPFSEYIFIDEIKVVKGTKSHFDVIYLVRKDIDISEIKLQKEEVESVEFVSWRDLKDRVSAGDKTLTDRPQEYDLLFDYLENNNL